MRRDRKKLRLRRLIHCSISYFFKCQNSCWKTWWIFTTEHFIIKATTMALLQTLRQIQLSTNFLMADGWTLFLVPASSYGLCYIGLFCNSSFSDSRVIKAIGVTGQHTYVRQTERYAHRSHVYRDNLSYCAFRNISRSFQRIWAVRLITTRMRVCPYFIVC